MLCVRLNPNVHTAQLTVTPNPESMETVTDFLSDALEKWAVPTKRAHKAQIGADEIYSNIVRYSGAHTATLTVTDDGAQVTLRFCDDGKPYDPTAAKAPDLTRSADEREIGGLGIFVVKKTAAKFDYAYRDGENHLTVVFTDAEGSR